MKQFKKIVVGLELTPEGSAVTVGSHKAAQQAIWVARANGGAIHYVHSTYDDEFRDPITSAQDLVHEGLSNAGIEAMESLVEESRNSGVEATLDICHDRVWIEITRMALRDDADLVIVGKRNASEEGGRRLGMVATKLLRKCPGPIWVVRPAHDLVHRLVLAATDLTPVGDLAIEHASYIAQRHDCNLHVVHAWQMPMALQLRSASMSEEEFAAAVDAIKQGIADQINGVLSDYPCEDGLTIHTSKGSPSQVIREAVAHLDPDLLVMGSISRAGIAGVLLGSTAERLLDLVDCSILAVKPADFVSPIQLD